MLQIFKILEFYVLRHFLILTSVAPSNLNELSTAILIASLHVGKQVHHLHFLDRQQTGISNWQSSTSRLFSLMATTALIF